MKRPGASPAASRNTYIDGVEGRAKVTGDVQAGAPATRSLDVNLDFASLFEGSPCPMWVFDVETLAFLEVNAAAVRRYGYSREEFLRMTLEDIRAAVDLPHFLAPLARVPGSDALIGPMGWGLRKKDGSVIDVEVRYLEVRFAGRSQKLAIVDDVTERKRLEAQTRNQTFLLATITDAVITTDERFILTGWNAAAETIYGWKAAEVLGLPAAEILEDPGSPTSEITRQLVESGRFRGELIHVRRDGERIYVEVTAGAITDAAGAPVSYVSVHRDLTESRRSEGLIRALLNHVVSAQEEERRRLARELHDDAAQVLASLLVGLRTIEKSTSLRAIRAAAGDLRTHVGFALGDIERIARGLRPAPLDDLGLAAALERLRGEFVHSFGITLDVVVGDLGDRRLASAVETNLYRIAQEALTNAAKYARAKNIHISLQRSDGQMQLIIEDDGQGFDSGPTASTRNLGLQGMRERADLLGGRFSVESRSGKGTTIRVCVPVGGRQ
jgi:PAS domain S-box-containing protein